MAAAELLLWRQRGERCTLYQKVLLEDGDWSALAIDEWVQAIMLDLDTDSQWHTVQPFFNSGIPQLPELEGLMCD